MEIVSFEPIIFRIDFIRKVLIWNAKIWIRHNSDPVNFETIIFGTHSSGIDYNVESENYIF